MEANDYEGSVHCADIEGIGIKPGSANYFGCWNLGKIPDISLSPKRVELLRFNYLTNTGAIELDYHQLLILHLTVIERQWARNIIINTSIKAKWQTFHCNLRPHQWERFFLSETARAFLSSLRLVCLVVSHHALPTSIGCSALGMHLHD